MDDEQNKKLAVLENEVNDHIKPDLKELKEIAAQHNIWFKLAMWTLVLVGAMNTPIGKKLIKFVTEP